MLSLAAALAHSTQNNFGVASPPLNERDFIVRDKDFYILTFISIGIIYSCFHLFTISSTLLLLYFVL